MAPPTLYIGLEDEDEGDAVQDEGCLACKAIFSGSAKARYQHFDCYPL